MGTTVSVVAPDDRGAAATRRWFERVEQICSRFRPDSELSRVNASPPGVIEVSPLLADVLGTAHELRAMTDGAVDVAMGAHIADWGYDRTFDDVGDVALAPAWRPKPNWSITGRRLERDPATLLDLGGVAKGWAADGAVEQGWAVMVNAGGDIRSADPSLVVEVLDPEGDVVSAVPVGAGALATSSTAKRRWQAAGREVHHILDPTTGEPARTPIVTASAVTATAVTAEAAAKAVLIKGGEGLAWASRRPWIRQAIALFDDGAAYATVAA